MAHQDLALRSALELGAWAVALAGGAVLGLALAAELLRRARRGAGLVALADRLLPTAAARVAAALLTAVAATTAIAMPHPARGDDVRSWLVDDAPGPVSTTLPPTSTTSRPATSTSTTPRAVTVPPGPPPPPAPAPVAPPRPRPVLRTPPAPVPAASAASAASPPPTARPGTAPATYTVRPGDCLWSIAAAHLGRDATARSIDRAWRAVYDANRDAVGPDPNLIHPGLTLSLPPLDPTP